MMRSRWMGVLRDKEGSEGGGGGADHKKLVDEVTAAVAGRFDAKFEELKGLFKPPKEPKEKQDPDPEPKDPKKDKDAGGGAAIAALQRQVSELKAQKEESDRRAEEKDRHSAIRSALSGFEWANKNAQNAAFRIFESEIKRNEAGELVAPDGTAADEWIAKQMEDEHDYLLKPKQVGGVGATNSGRKEKPIDLNDIKPGMSAEDLARVRAEIARLAQ